MAKFFVGQRVRKVRFSGDDSRWEKIPIGSEGTIIKRDCLDFRFGDEILDWVVKYDGYVGNVDGGFAAYEWMLEPITDTWAQDKVAQLVKQCMPVAA